MRRPLRWREEQQQVQSPAWYETGAADDTAVQKNGAAGGGGGSSDGDESVGDEEEIRKGENKGNSTRRMMCYSGRTDGDRFWCDKMADTVILMTDGEEYKCRGCAGGGCSCQPCELRGMRRAMWNRTAGAAEEMITQRMMDEMHRGVRYETATMASFVGPELTGEGFCRIRGHTALPLDEEVSRGSDAVLGTDPAGFADNIMHRSTIERFVKRVQWRAWALRCIDLYGGWPDGHATWNSTQWRMIEGEPRGHHDLLSL